MGRPGRGCLKNLFHGSHVIIFFSQSILSWNRLGGEQETPPLCPVDFTEDEHLYWDSGSTAADGGQGNPARVAVKGKPVPVVLDRSPPERRKRKPVRVPRRAGPLGCSGVMAWRVES